MSISVFTVSVDFKVDRAVWRASGFGDQPSKAEISTVFRDFVAEIGWSPSTVVKYMGAPGNYRVIQQFEANMPWWRVAGFGDRASRAEVKGWYNVWVREFAKEWQITVGS